LADPVFAAPLADLLAQRGMTGHALSAEGPTAEAAELKRGNRNEALREIVLARALFRCGDPTGLARRILASYRKDVRGLFARHAHAVLTAETPD
jgi:hypothetical protein